MSMTGHPRNRRAYATRQGDQEAEARRGKHRDENRVPLLASALRLSPLQPTSLSSQAHIWPWLPLAYLDSACFRRPCLRLFKRRPQPLALSACKQRSPDFVPPAHALPASIPAAVPRQVAWTCGSHTNFLQAPPSVGPRTFNLLDHLVLSPSLWRACSILSCCPRGTRPPGHPPVHSLPLRGPAPARQDGCPLVAAPSRVPPYSQPLDQNGDMKGTLSACNLVLCMPLQSMQPYGPHFHFRTHITSPRIQHETM